MGRTLFRYIFWDLLRIFMLASGALAGIMSFGGLLRPVTEQGLGAAQVARMLTYFQPAMWTYALPVAALFATTMVYGRLSADNEVTACRAAGVSALWVALPAMVLGLVVSIVSLGFLYFIVPLCTLKVEKVIYSNLAQIVANQVTRNHRIEMASGTGGKPVTIFAQSAQVLPTPADRPKDQVVRLVAPVFVNYEPGKSTGDKEKDRQRVTAPQDFFIARTATAFITQDDETGEVYLQAVLDNGMKFPRRFRGNESAAMQISVEQTQFFSDPMESPVRENTKFMPLQRLKELLREPEKSRRLRKDLNEFIREDQRQTYLQSLANALTGSKNAARFETGSETYILERGSASVDVRGDHLIIGSTETPPDPLPRLLQLDRERTDGATVLNASAKQIELRVTPTISSDPANKSNQKSGAEPLAPTRRLNVEMELSDVSVQTGTAQSGTTTSPRSRFPRGFSVPMPAELTELELRRVKDYRTGTMNLSSDRNTRMQRDWMKLTNSIISELHARASFSVSCLILVMVGCALGMMFRSGNFLSAFAVSVIPAMVCILLIITGQHTCENVPWDIKNFHNEAVMQFGVTMIWLGNAVVLALAVGMLWRLQRQ